jgi:hypothetical protein
MVPPLLLLPLLLLPLLLLLVMQEPQCHTSMCRRCVCVDAGAHGGRRAVGARM